jgi:hypothetical protein
LKFTGTVLGRTLRTVHLSDLEELADVLFEVVSEEKKKAGYLKALSEHVIVDRESLVNFGIGKFVKLDFGFYGKGTAFAGKVLGRSVKRWPF